MTFGLVILNLTLLLFNRLEDKVQSIIPCWSARSFLSFIAVNIAIGILLFDFIGWIDSSAGKVLAVRL